MFVKIPSKIWIDYYHVPEKGIFPAQLVTFSFRDQGRQSQKAGTGEGLWASRGMVSAYWVSIGVGKDQQGFPGAQDTAGTQPGASPACAWWALPTFPTASLLSPSCAPFSQPRVLAGQRTRQPQCCHLVYLCLAVSSARNTVVLDLFSF